MEFVEEYTPPKNSPRTNDEESICDKNSERTNPICAKHNKAKVLCPEKSFKGKPKLSNASKSKGICNVLHKNSERNIDTLGGALKHTPSIKTDQKTPKRIPKRSKCKIHMLPALDKTLEEFSDIPQEWFEKKVWDILCNHSSQLGHHTKEEYFRRLIKWRKGCVNELSDDACVLCEIQKATSKSLRSNLDLDRLNYTHEYYNKFSRSVNSDKCDSAHPCDEKENALNNSKLSPTNHETQAICPRVFSNIVLPCRLLPSPMSEILRTKSVEVPGSNSNSNPALTTAGEDRSSPDSEHTDSRAEKLRQMYMPYRKIIHKKCKPKKMVVQLAPQKAVSKLHILYKRNAFKGLPLRIRGNGNKVDQDCPQTESYEIENLGLRFNLPDYNPNLGNRHVSIPKSYTYQPVVVMHRGTVCPAVHRDGNIQSTLGESKSIKSKMLVPIQTSTMSSNFVKSSITSHHGSAKRLLEELEADDSPTFLPPIRQFPVSILTQCAH